MADHRKFPYTSFPTGWYQVAWGDEITDTPKPLRYFETPLVAFRGESGRAQVFNAMCPHMGAHLGWGGTVVGDGIECPYHGWQFDAEGKNCLIPYAERPNRTKIRKWHVEEVGSLVLVWFDQKDRAPLFPPVEVPEFADTENFLAPAETRKNYENVFLKPQFITENLVDAAHQKFVHRAAEIPEIYRCEADGPTFHVDSTIIFGNGKNKKTWLTPDGKPLAAALRTTSAGVGIAVARFEIDGSVHIQCTTPVDHERCDSRQTVLVPMNEVEDGRPTEKAIKRFHHELIQFERDLVIWEHQEYVHPVPYPHLERDRFRAFRNWTSQFYPEAEPGHFGRYRTDDTTEAIRPVAQTSA